jgi:hypothetical protein
MEAVRTPCIRALAQAMGYCVILVMTIVAAAVAQPPANSPGPRAPLPPGTPADPNPTAQQPVAVAQTESLEFLRRICRRSSGYLGAIGSLHAR